MKLNDIIHLDENYDKYIQFCNDNNFVLKEIEPDENGSRYQVVKIKIDTRQDEINKLKDWFNDYYSVHEQKYRRLVYLNKLDDDGATGQSKLEKLYIEAEEKRKILQDLEE